MDGITCSQLFMILHLTIFLVGRVYSPSCCCNFGFAMGLVWPVQRGRKELWLVLSMLLRFSLRWLIPLAHLHKKPPDKGCLYLGIHCRRAVSKKYMFVVVSHWDFGLFTNVFVLPSLLFTIKKPLAGQNEVGIPNRDQGLYPGLPGAERLATHWETEESAEDNGIQVSCYWEKRKQTHVWEKVELELPDLANKNIGYHLGRIYANNFCFFLSEIQIELGTLHFIWQS